MGRRELIRLCCTPRLLIGDFPGEFRRASVPSPSLNTSFHASTDATVGWNRRRTACLPLNTQSRYSRAAPAAPHDPNSYRAPRPSFRQEASLDRMSVGDCHVLSVASSTLSARGSEVSSSHCVQHPTGPSTEAAAPSLVSRRPSFEMSDINQSVDCRKIVKDVMS